jgi:hypothetical protein
VRLLSLSLLACLCGCQLDATFPDTDGPGDGDSLDPYTKDESIPIPTNGLRLDLEIASKLRVLPLSGDWVHEVASTEEGLEHLSYAITCSLDPQSTLVVAGRELRGYYQLAPEWMHEECDEDCRRWVSACMLAHVNRKGQGVQISVRGLHPGLLEPDLDFPSEEAAFYGDLFTGDADTIEAYACAGRLLVDAGKETADDMLSGRLCFGSCPIDVTGFCNANNFPVCERVLDESGYSDCHTRGPAGPLPNNPAYTQVATVYVRN